MSDLRVQRHAVRLSAPIWMSNFHSVPGFIRLLYQLNKSHSLPFVLDRPQNPPFVEERHEPMDICMFGDQAPVEPIELVVMAVRIVVAVLCPPDLVTHQHHGHADREKRDGEEIFYL